MRSYQELQGTVREARAFHTSIRETSEVIKDLNTLHRVIREFLSSDLFSSERAKK